MITKAKKGLKFADGCYELTSDDGQILIQIKKITAISDDGHFSTAYVVNYFCKEGLEWERAVNTESFRTIKEIFNRLEASDQFLEALENLKEQ